MEKIQRIKLLMGYNSSKTLNENIDSLNIIVENNQTEIDEAGAQTVAKDLENALRYAGEDVKTAETAMNNVSSAVGFCLYQMGQQSIQSPNYHRVWAHQSLEDRMCLCR